MRWLLAVTVGMGVLIVTGVVLLAVLLVQRTFTAPGAPTEVVLQQPPDTRMEGASLAGPDRAVVRLRGGGPDRVVVVDLKTGRIAATIGLSP